MDPRRETIDFAEYVEVKAHLSHFPDDKQGEVIARLGLDRATWETASAKWAAARAAELESGGTDLTTRFGTIFARTRRRLATQRPTLESLGPLPPPPAAAPALAPKLAPPPQPEPPAPPPEVQLSSAQRGAPQPELPSFLANQAIGRSPPIAIEPASTPAPRPAAHLASTMPLGAELPISKLPFLEAPTSPDRAYENAVAHALVVQGPAESRRDVGAAGGTGTVGVSTVGPASAVLPFPVLPPAGCPDLTITQYASLRVELQLYPDRTDAILTRYGVAVGARDALSAHWRSRMEADPLMRMEFARAYASYVSWIRQNQQPA